VNVLDVPNHAGLVPDGQFALVAFSYNKGSRTVRAVTAYEPTNPAWRLRNWRTHRDEKPRDFELVTKKSPETKGSRARSASPAGLKTLVNLAIVREQGTGLAPIPGGSV
jgi:hypothetical protein